MEIGNWTEKYSVDHALLDGQHKTLLEILGKMAKFVESNVAPERMVGLLTEMSDYAIEHFKSEEGYMKQIGYPNLDEHAELHGSYSLAVLKFTINHLTDSPDAPEKVLRHLIDWWTQHILLEDKKYAEFAKNGSKKD